MRPDTPRFRFFQPTSGEVANKDLLAQGKLFSDVGARAGYVPQ